MTADLTFITSFNSRKNVKWFRNKFRTGRKRNN